MGKGGYWYPPERYYGDFSAEENRNEPFQESSHIGGSTNKDPGHNVLLGLTGVLLQITIDYLGYQPGLDQRASTFDFIWKVYIRLSIHLRSFPLFGNCCLSLGSVSPVYSTCL